jgi:hypothetical protein
VSYICLYDAKLYKHDVVGQFASCERMRKNVALQLPNWCERWRQLAQARVYIRIRRFTPALVFLFPPNPHRWRLHRHLYCRHRCCRRRPCLCRRHLMCATQSQPHALRPQIRSPKTCLLRTPMMCTLSWTTRSLRWSSYHSFERQTYPHRQGNFASGISEWQTRAPI